MERGEQERKERKKALFETDWSTNKGIIEWEAIFRDLRTISPADQLFHSES